MISAPAARMRSTMIASSSGTKSAKRCEPNVVRRPRVRARSLIACGTPCRGPEDLTPRDGVIGLPRLRQKLVPRPKRDDRVDGGVGPLDVVEIGRHHLLG